jgi:hypothetical protein
MPSKLIVKNSNSLKVIGLKIPEEPQFNPGQVLTLAIELEISEKLKYIFAVLVIYDYEGNRRFSSTHRKIENSPSGRVVSYFYFLPPIIHGGYAATFEFFQNKELTEKKLIDASNDEEVMGSGEELENPNLKLISANNLYIKFTTQNENLNNSIKKIVNEEKLFFLVETITFDHASQSEWELIGFTPQNISTVFPWPVANTTYSQTEISDAIFRFIGKENNSDSHLCAIMTPRCNSRTFYGNSPLMGSNVGERLARSIRTTGKTGFLIFGPYLPVTAGRYSATFHGKVGVCGIQNILLEIVAENGNKLIQIGHISQSNMGEFRHLINFSIPSFGYIDLEFRLKVNGTDQLELFSVTVSPAKQQPVYEAGSIDSWLPLILEQNRQNLSNVYSKEINASNKTDGYVLIFIPNELFTICGIILALHLFRTANRKVLLVSEFEFQKSITETIKNLCGIESCILLSNLENELAGRCVEIVVTQADYTYEQTIDILEKIDKFNPNIELHIYPDGFRNDATNMLSTIRPISKIYYFGERHFDSTKVSGIPAEVVSFSTTRQAIARLSQGFELHLEENFDRTKYVVFCLRYWTEKAYNFPSEVVAQCWFDTVLDHCENNELIILKGINVNYLNNPVISYFIKKLENAGFRFIFADDYLKQIELNPRWSEIGLEYLICQGIFSSATCFFTLDSSLPSILGQLDALRRPCNIILGCKDLLKLSQLEGFDIAKYNIRQQYVSCANSKALQPLSIKVLSKDTYFKITLD